MKKTIFEALAQIVGVGQAFTVKDVIVALRHHPEAARKLGLMGCANMSVLSQIVGVLVGESAEGLTLVRTRASRRGHLYALVSEG